MRPRKLITLTALLALVGSVGYSATVFTAANTVSNSKAGEGSGTVTGYTVSGIDYTLNATNPSNIDSVSFTLAPAPPASGQVRIKLNAQAYNCTVAAAVATCATTAPQAAVLATTTLSVIAAD